MQVPCLITDVNTIGERLKLARDLKSWTQEDLANAAGVSQGTIGNIESGLRKRPRELLAIAKALGVGADWLQDGIGNFAEGKTDSERPIGLSAIPLSTVSTYSDTNFFRAPAIDWARLGEVLFRPNKELDQSSFQPFLPSREHGPNVKLIKVEDDSLAPRISRGDWVAIDPDNVKPERGNVILVRAKSDGVFFLRRFQPLIHPAFEAVDAKGNVMDSTRHLLEIVGVACGVKLFDL